jgi:hypothetical protein
VNMIASIPMARPTGRCFRSKSKSIDWPLVRGPSE